MNKIIDWIMVSIGIFFFAISIPFMIVMLIMEAFGLGRHAKAMKELNER